MKGNPFKWINKYRVHIIVWLVYMAYETLLIGFLYEVFGHPVTYITHYTINISFFYFNAHVSLPWAARGKWIVWRIILVVLAQGTAIVFINLFADSTLIKYNIMDHVEKVELEQKFILSSLYRYVLFLGLSAGYYYLTIYTRERSKRREMELDAEVNRQRMDKELALSQVAMLKAQINPHFLFNTLDFVYHKVYAVSPEASEAIITLSEMMRYAIDSDKRGEFVPVAEELEQLGNLINLYQLRNDNQLQIQLDYTEEAAAAQIIPLVLLTLVENIFKHGQLKDTAMPAQINLSVVDDNLVITTRNACSTFRSPRSNNKGLNNIRQRLLSAYGEGIIFEYALTGDQCFTVHISVPLTD